MSNKKTILKVVCAWCSKSLGEKDGQGQAGTSHGICPACAAIEMAKIAEMAKLHNCDAQTHVGTAVAR